MIPLMVAGLSPHLTRLQKSPTGITGLDEITRGGLPQGRTTLIEGAPGSGKTVLALQALVNGAKQHHEPGIFVAFEESSRQIVANAASFGWDLPALQRKKLFFLDAHPSPDWHQAGGFDLGGMLAALDAKVRSMGAKRIVFDALDVVLALLDDPAAERREIYRLHHWLQERQITAIITSKSAGDRNSAPNPERATFFQFMVDCAISLSHTMVQNVLQRSLRVMKYRGSPFAENESPLLIGDDGLEVAGAGDLVRRAPAVTKERVSTGVERIDTMLEGGYYRGAGVLITGAPGTAKSTLCGAFAEAACKRGEPTLYVTFDSDPDELVRNLESVGIRLGKPWRAGLLHLMSGRTGMVSAETHFLRIKAAARQHGSRCVVVDPVSALAKQGNELAAHSVVERLTDWAKSTGVTLVCSSLLETGTPETEGTSLQISTIADTWIHLSYLVHGGERNRALTIIKSRGTAHSNQVRELLLTDKGVTLTDVYTAGGEVLMGTLRWEMEQARRQEERRAQTEAELRLHEIDRAEEEIGVRLRALERDLAVKRAERESLKLAASQSKTTEASHRASMRGLRMADPEKPARRRAQTT